MAPSFRRSGVLLALCAVPAANAAAVELRVPTCAEFVGYGQKWVGLDENAAAQVLGVPLYALTDADIDLIDKSLRNCVDAARTADEKAILLQDLKHVSTLRAERDHVRRAFAEFESAKKEAGPKLEQIAAKLDALSSGPKSRSAVEDAQATVSAIFFELEQKRLRAQVKEPLGEDFPAYSRAVAALARKRQAYAAEAQKQLLADAKDALERHRADLQRLGLPSEALDAAIILEQIDTGRDVRWLTLRQWVALLLSNPENTAVRVLPRAQDDRAGLLRIEVVRPGYSTAEFGFRQQELELHVVESGVDGHLAAIDTADRRRETNGLLLAVARAQ